MKMPYFQYFELDVEKLPTNGSGWAKIQILGNYAFVSLSTSDECR